MNSLASQIITDAGLPRAQQHILRAFAETSDLLADIVAPGTRWIARRSGYCDTYVDRIMAILEAEGILVRIARRGRCAPTKWAFDLKKLALVEAANEPQWDEASESPDTPPTVVSGDSAESSQVEPDDQSRPELQAGQSGETIEDPTRAPADLDLDLDLGFIDLREEKEDLDPREPVPEPSPEPLPEPAQDLRCLAFDPANSCPHETEAIERLEPLALNRALEPHRNLHWCLHEYSVDDVVLLFEDLKKRGAKDDFYWVGGPTSPKVADELIKRAKDASASKQPAAAASIISAPCTHPPEMVEPHDDGVTMMCFKCENYFTPEPLSPERNPWKFYMLLPPRKQALVREAALRRLSRQSPETHKRVLQLKGRGRDILPLLRATICEVIDLKMTGGDWEYGEAPAPPRQDE